MVTNRSFSALTNTYIILTFLFLVLHALGMWNQLCNYPWLPILPTRKANCKLCSACCNSRVLLQPTYVGGKLSFEPSATKLSTPEGNNGDVASGQFSHSFIYLFIHSFIHSFICSFTWSVVHSLSFPVLLELMKLMIFHSWSSFTSFEACSKCSGGVLVACRKNCDSFCLCVLPLIMYYHTYLVVFKAWGCETRCS